MKKAHYKLAADTVHGVYEIEAFPPDAQVHAGDLLSVLPHIPDGGIEYGLVDAEELQTMSEDYEVMLLERGAQAPLRRDVSSNELIKQQADRAVDLLTMRQPDDHLPAEQYSRATSDLIALAYSIGESSTGESTWWIECGKMGISLPDLLTGAYWHYTEYHRGMASPEYKALSALGRIYNPGMEEPDPENEIYQALDALAEKASA